MRLDGWKIRRMIYDADMTQATLALKAGISKNCVCSIVNGKSCREDTGRKIADALGVPLEQLLKR